MNEITELIAWLKTNPGILPADADYFRGMAKDAATNAAKRLVSVTAVGGPKAGVELDRMSYRVIVFGKQGPVANDSEGIHDALRAICRRLKTDYKACDIAQIQVIGGIIGPGLTTENRPWYELNLQLLT